MPDDPNPDAAEAQTWIGLRLNEIAGAKSPLTREAELELLKHFGARGHAGQTAELGARGFEAVTASPATRS